MIRLGRLQPLRTALLAAGLAALASCTDPAPDAPAGSSASGGPDSATPTPDQVATGLLRAVTVEGRPAAFSLEERMAHHAVPGVSVALLDGGRVAWARGWGVADTETGAPVTPETLFQAASISKPVAALAALSLVDEGAVELDDPVNDHLESWRLPGNEHTADSAVTLRGLLTHSAGTTVSGFPGYRKDRPFSEGRAAATNAQVLEGEGNTDPVRVYKVPGTSWQYSGGGYTVMEQMVEDVTGLPFEEAARLRVLEPAGMTRSTFAQPLPEARWDQAARGHGFDGAEVQGEWHTYPEQAAAGLWTTPSDLLTLSAHLLGIREGRVEDGVLSGGMLEAALTPHHPGDERYRGWGLGFALAGEGDAATFGHGGSNAGFKAQWTVYRDRGQGIAVMTNGDRGSALAAEIVRGVAAAWGWPGREPQRRATRSATAGELAAYEGVYRMAGRPEVELDVRAHDDSLTVAVSLQGTSTLLPAAEPADEFFDPDDATILRFLRDEEGRVVAATNGGDQRFDKVR